MWTAAPGNGRWARDDGDDGYLLAVGELMYELHGAVLHTYRRDPDADRSKFVGSPLDGFVPVSTEPADEVQRAPAARVDAARAWRFLGDRADKRGGGGHQGGSR